MGRFQVLWNRDTNERVVEKLIADALTVDDDPMDRAEAIAYVERQLAYAIEAAAAWFDSEVPDSKRQLRAGAHYLAVSAQATIAHDLAHSLAMTEREVWLAGRESERGS
jgi:hypothetical protein